MSVGIIISPKENKIRFNFHPISLQGISRLYVCTYVYMCMYVSMYAGNMKIKKNMYYIQFFKDASYMKTGR